MTKAEAIRHLVHRLGDEDAYAMEEKYNRFVILFGIEDGRPTRDGDDWVCKIETTYGAAVSWKFIPVKQSLNGLWTELDEIWDGELRGDADDEAWTVLGYDLTTLTV